MTTCAKATALVLKDLVRLSKTLQDYCTSHESDLNNEKKMVICCTYAGSPRTKICPLLVRNPSDHPKDSFVFGWRDFQGIYRG